MVVNNLNIPCILAIPSEANPKLIVNADAPLAFSSAFQLFQPIARGLIQIRNRRGKIDGVQSPKGQPRQFTQSPALAAAKNRFCLGIGKGLNHA
jgi:hypothetical protein